jgi:hypothetical protein
MITNEHPPNQEMEIPDAVGEMPMTVKRGDMQGYQMHFLLGTELPSSSPTSLLTMEQFGLGYSVVDYTYALSHRHTMDMSRDQRFRNWPLNIYNPLEMNQASLLRLRLG